MADKPSGGRVMVAPANQDSLLVAIVKWIPVEVLTVYKTVDGVIPQQRNAFRLGFTCFGIISSALWIAFATKPTGKKIAWRQVILAPIAFTCWVIAMEGDAIKMQWPDWEFWMGSLILGIGTISLPILDGILKAVGIPQDR
jgi:hypothetical protein